MLKLIIVLLVVCGAYTVPSLGVPEDDISDESDLELQKREEEIATRLIQRSVRDKRFAQLLSEHEQSAEGDSTINNGFNCGPFTGSPVTPTSVHKLTPGDIDIVAALGDSLTAGRAIKNGVVGILFDFRGVSWSVGGDASAITVPNYLKKYNHNLQGYSRGIQTDGKNLNMAVTGAKSPALLNQAKELVNILKTDDRYKAHFNTHWKLVTIFIGANDLCAFCKDMSLYSARNFKENVRKTLDYLQANLPRAFVNLVNLFQIEQMKDAASGAVCDTAHKAFCECIAHPQGNQREQVIQLRKEYQAALRSLGNSDKYQTKNDFTVVLQPFFENTLIPRLKNHTVDQDYFASDCFHFSILGQGAMARALWTNMFQPVNQKTHDWRLGQPLVCPTHNSPYLQTKKNVGDVLG